jgi:hypothetical protein
VRRPWAALRWECRERSYRFGEVARCCGHDAVMIDDCDVGTRGGFGCWLWGLSRESAGEEECGG